MLYLKELMVITSNIIIVIIVASTILLNVIEEPIINFSCDLMSYLSM